MLLMFAIGAVGAAGYQIVRLEAAQALRGAETTRALSVAEGGLQWFVGRQGGLVPRADTVRINGGTATISARKIAALSPSEDLYLVTSVGTYADPRHMHAAASRTVSEYAVLKRLPVKVLASLITTSSGVRVGPGAVVDGTDHAVAGQCAEAPASPWAGVLARGNALVRKGGTLLGAPPHHAMGSFKNVVEAAEVPWDVLTDSQFPVDHDGSWPDFSSLAGSSSPVIRVNGDFAPTSYHNGHGVLIVTGSLTIPPASGWHWRGIVMAGALEDVGPDGVFTVEGMLVAGQGAPMGRLTLDAGRILYHSCYAAWAGFALAHLTAVTS
ncbi:MAG: hypothetical protein HKO65_18755 [Gemmatimonadetes bacterium]|nr:hypothetical protein [Gemmatimonadota bacterium]